MNELEEMRERLETRRVVMGNMSTRCKVATEDARKQEEMISSELRSLLVAGTSLSVARKRLQVKYFYSLLKISIIFGISFDV